jgi:hypothetical protein
MSVLRTKVAAVGIVGALVGGAVGFTAHAAASTSDPTVSSYVADAQAHLSAAQDDLASAAALPTPTVTVTDSPSPAPTVTVTATPSDSPTASPTLSPTPSSSASTQPGTTNTGVPAGTSLVVWNGDLTITVPGQTFTGLDIHGYLRVEAPNVTVKDSIIRGGTGDNGLGVVADVTPSATNFLLEDSEVVPQFPVVDLDDVKGYNYTLLRDNIHGSEDGAKMYGPNATIQDSWIHGLVTYPHDPAQNNGPSHSDGVQIQSGSNLKLIHNTITGQPNSSVIITEDNGKTSGVLIDGNWLGTEGSPAPVCTVKILNKPLPSMSGITVTNNRFDHNATACQILDSKTVTLVASGNVFDDTGLPVKLLNTASTS